MDDSWFRSLGFNFGVGEWYEGEPIEVGLLDVLQIEKADLHPIALALFDSDKAPPEWVEKVSSLSWAVRSYLQFQDLQRTSFTHGKDRRIGDYFNRHYCYYESVVYLRQSVRAWTTGNHLAAITLLRPFLELSLLHTYWYLRGEKKGYSHYYEWLKGDRGTPPFKNMLEDLFTDLHRAYPEQRKRIDVLKRTLRGQYRALCTYNHASSMDESLTLMSPEENMTYYAVTLDFLMRQVIFTYTLTYPMILHPVEAWVKFGFSWPAGLYSAPSASAIVERYLGTDNFRQLASASANKQEVLDLVGYFQDQPNKTASHSHIS